ncbi:MAG: YaeQ family protein [Deltaproteobacteria bacterium]|nr:MAG: YaeQ family protein [Deltaproteobacteria bacterium]
MALPATIYRLRIDLSDVDRGVYEALDLRLARHPSETLRYLITRTLAYCLSYEDGVAFSKGGLSSTDQAPVAIHDPTGRLVAWIDIGSPSAERLHKASKAADRVAIFTTADPELLQRDAASKGVFRASEIPIFRIDPDFVEALEPHLDRNTALEVLHTDGHLYVTVDGQTLDGAVRRIWLAPPEG